MKIKDLERIQIISGFPGVGKSTYIKQCDDDAMLDSDSSKWGKDDFPNNYVDYIDKMINEGKTILCSSHEEVRKELESRGFKYAIVYPDISLKDEYITRYTERGSPEGFLKLLDEQWDNFIKSCEDSKAVKQYVLQSGEYMSDVLDEAIYG